MSKSYFISNVFCFTMFREHETRLQSVSSIYTGCPKWLNFRVFAASQMKGLKISKLKSQKGSVLAQHVITHSSITAHRPQSSPLPFNFGLSLFQQLIKVQRPFAGQGGKLLDRFCIAIWNTFNTASARTTPYHSIHTI